MSTKLALLVVSALAFFPTGAAAQATAAPVWAKPDHFWYRRAVPGGNLWLHVDAQHGVREPLFDHQRLAIELTIRTGVEFTALTLPFADPAAQFVVKYDGSNAYVQEGAMAIEFVHDGHLWRCDLQTKWNWNKVPPTDYECLTRRAIDPQQPSTGTTGSIESAPRLSPDGRWEALVQHHNIAIRPAGSATATSTVLSSDGSPDSAYQAGSIRWAADSKTFTAYRVSSEVWQSESIAGSVKKGIVQGHWSVP